MTVTVSSSVHFPELEKYEFIEEIGHGGMATVYRARDLRLDREVAVKVIHKHLRENVEVRRRFVSEAKAVAKLRHRGIVEVYDVSAQDDVERYLVVELIRGMSLRQLLTARGTLPPEIAAIMDRKEADPFPPQDKRSTEQPASLVMRSALLTFHPKRWLIVFQL